MLLPAGLPLPAAPAAAPAATSNLVRNGSFEQPEVRRGEFRHVDEIDGWERSAGSKIEVQHRLAGPPADGDQHVELDARATGAPPAITQRIPTKPGRRYLLTFAFGARPATVDGQNAVDVSWGGLALAHVDAHAGVADGQNVRWRYHRYVVTATAARTPLTFAYSGPVDSFGGYLDDVRLEAVPDGTSKQVSGKVERDEDGWAAADGGTYGGALGDVTTIADPKTAASDLREALTSKKPRRVVLDLPTVDGAPAVVRLNDEIELASYKTVSATRPVVVTTKRGSPEASKDRKGKDLPARCRREQPSAFVLRNVDQVEISGLVFDGMQPDDCWPRDSEGADAITIEGSRHVWIHGNTFRRWPDSAIDVLQGLDGRSRASDYVTASWNRFEQIFQANAWQVEHASFHHNHCVLVGRRCPKTVTAKRDDVDSAVRPAFVHAYDNVVEKWDVQIVFAHAFDADAVLWAQQNAFLGSCAGSSPPPCPSPGARAPGSWQGTVAGTAEGDGACLAMGGENLFRGDARSGVTGTDCLPDRLRDASRIWNAPEPMTPELVDVVRNAAGAGS